MLKKLYTAAASYVALGLVGGVFYREFTRINEVTIWTQLKVVHTHFLALGALVFFIVLGLEKLFRLSEAKQFRGFFLFYNLGLVWSATMMIVKGIMSSLDHPMANSAMIAGISGIGHILLTVGFVLLLVAHNKRVWADAEPA
ncbi:MAG: DUF2871 domain-containing protein [Propionibacteriaceae bacterium]|nr:DUF2871 domain-containing protein [Propionibacteriaceae bacterium]